MRTPLISMSVHMTGFYDSGWTHITVSVRRSMYDPAAPVGQAVSDQESVWAKSAEVYLSDQSEANLTTMLMGGLDQFVSALQLP